MHVFINRFTVHGDTEEFERLLGGITAHMTRQPGFLSHQLYRSAADPKVYTETARWADGDAHRQAVTSEGFLGPVAQLMKLATAEPGAFTLVAEHTLPARD